MAARSASAPSAGPASPMPARSPGARCPAPTRSRATAAAHGAPPRADCMVAVMATQQEKAERFLAMHRSGQPLLMPNPWDIGSARLLAALGFAALATTSSGFAATLGRPDGAVSRDEAIAHAAGMVAAVEVPVSADLENCFADEPDGVAETVRLAVAAGLAGC